MAFVVGIDSSTTATKAIAWTENGTPEQEGRCSIPLNSPVANWYEQDPLDWWNSSAVALKQLTEKIPADQIAAVAVSNQRETFAVLGPDGNAFRPGIVWLDQRSREEVPWLSGRVGPKRIHQISGKPVDMAPVAYRIAWLLRNEPETHRAAAMFCDVHAYLTWKLTGKFRTSWASADPLGLFDLEAKKWSPEILGPLEIDEKQLPEALAPGTVLGEVTAEAAAATGLRPGTPVVAGGGDGQVAGLGVNALASERAYLNLGTAVVGGVYITDYAIDLAWRTMGSGSGVGYYCETSLRTGTFLVDWFVKNLCGSDGADKGIYARLEAEAEASPVGSNGLLLVPYWGAVMTPYWDQQARGAMVGFLGGHNRGDIYRSLLEGVALEQELVNSMIEEHAGVKVQEYIAIGGGAGSALWRRIIADISGKTVKRSQTVEASSLGAAMCAAVAAGWFSGMKEAAEAMSGATTTEVEPDPKRAARYAELMGIYRDIYPQTRDLSHRLTRFAEGG